MDKTTSTLYSYLHGLYFSYLKRGIGNCISKTLENIIFSYNKNDLNSAKYGFQKVIKSRKNILKILYSQKSELLKHEEGSLLIYGIYYSKYQFFNHYISLIGRNNLFEETYLDEHPSPTKIRLSEDILYVENMIKKLEVEQTIDKKILTTLLETGKICNYN